MKEKLILDATCGFRMMWFDKHNPNCLYIDQRSECEPDEVQDFRHLPYPDNSFRLVVFDPPHFKFGRNPNHPLNRCFGLLNAETWQSDLAKGFRELWRVLEPKGILILKWSDHDIKYKRVLKLFPVKPIFGQTTVRRQTKHGKTNTFWFCFMKIPTPSPLLEAETK